MRIRSIRVTNFRALRDVELDLLASTVLIGENNCGKSAFLKALDLFFSGSPRVKAKDFSDDNINEPINITIHFGNLTPHERDEFSANLLDGELVVTRQLLANGGKEHGQYYVSAKVNPAFTGCRNEENKTEKRKLYEALQVQFDLPTVRAADQIDGNLEAWEVAHPGELRVQRVGSFKGWKNVAVGKLKQKTDYIFVRAMEDAEQIEGDKNSPVKALVNTMARQTIENSERFKAFLQQANAEIAELTNPNNVPLLAEISTGLTDILTRYYRDSGIRTTWEPIHEIQPSFPTAMIEVSNNEFQSGIDGVGHGLQRAIIFTVLQYMAERRALTEAHEQRFAEAQSDIVIAIEEPESFQHPIKQRLFASVLRSLSRGFNEATGIRIQTIIVTHSPLMVSLAECEDIRLVRHVAFGDKRNVVANEINLANCSLRSADVSGRAPEDAWTAEQYAAKLHTFNTEIAEGFFARCVVLVEGVGDKAVLNAAYSIADRNPHAEGIVIVDVTGKNNLDKPIVIFDALDIPCYWVFDSDRGEGRAKAGSIKANRILQILGGVASEEAADWPEGVFDRFAAWDHNLEDYVSEKAGEELFNEALREVTEGFHIRPEVCLKFPASASFMLSMLTRRGVRFVELEAVIEKVDRLLG